MHVARSQLGRQTVTLAIEQQQRVITHGLEVPVVGAILLFAVDRNLGRIHVQHCSVRRIDRFCIADQLSVYPCQPSEVFLLSQKFRLEGLQPGRQCCPSIPILLGTDQPERRILGELLGIVHILVARQATVHGLP